MKKKTINAVICKKFDEFLSSIEDESVRNLVNQNTLITGGCIASMLLKEDVNDYDLYFTNKETVLAVAKYYVEKFNKNNPNAQNGFVLDGAKASKTEGGFVGSANISDDRVKIVFESNGIAREDGEESKAELQEEFDFKKQVEEEKLKEKPLYRPVFLSSNAITLSQQIQIVIRFYGEPDQVHDNYDFVHCTNYWTSKDRKVVLKQDALESILAKELVYIGSKYPLASVIRTRKFIKRNWHINAGQYLKMAFQISKLDLTDINVLEDQLTGVDSAYFGMLIDALKQADESAKKENKENTISYGYLSAIVDKIF